MAGVEQRLGALKTEDIAEQTFKSFEEADSKRAMLAKAHSAWRSKADTKHKEALQSVNELSTQILAAASVLEDLEVALRYRYEAHFEAWRQINAAAEERQLAKLHLVQEQCDSLRGAALPLAHSTTEIEKIRAQMVALNTRMEEQAALHARQMRTVIAEAEEQMASWVRHSEGLTAERELLKSALPAAAVPLSQEETAGRLASAALVADSRAPSIDGKG